MCRVNKLTLSHQTVVVELCSEIEQRIYHVMHFQFTQTRNTITLVMYRCDFVANEAENSCHVVILVTVRVWLLSNCECTVWWWLCLVAINSSSEGRLVSAGWTRDPCSCWRSTQDRRPDLWCSYADRRLAEGRQRARKLAAGLLTFYS